MEKLIKKVEVFNFASIKIDELELISSTPSTNYCLLLMIIFPFAGVPPELF